LSTHLVASLSARYIATSDLKILAIEKHSEHMAMCMWHMQGTFQT